MRDAEHSGVNLAGASDFMLGDAFVQPSRRTIGNADISMIVEPRVMQVLVALAETPGRIVSRDELIERCWAGRIVGENAIHRAVSQARQITASVGNGSLAIETIKGVGYRLASGAGDDSQMIAPAVALETSSAGKLTRRAAIAASAVAAVGGLAWLNGGIVAAAEASDLSLELYERGHVAQRDGLPDRLVQAVAYYRDAIRDSPEFTRAWGSLALSYVQVLDNSSDQRGPHLAALSDSAARKALALDPGNVDAQAALLLKTPFFRNWSQLGAPLRRLSERYPDHWFVRMQLGSLFADIGEVGPAAREFRRALAIDPLLPQASVSLFRSLWAGGQLQEAEEVMEVALRRWRGNWFLWNSQFQYLAFGGQPDVAERFISDKSTLPMALSDKAVPKRLTIVRAIQTSDAGLTDQVRTAYLEEATQTTMNLGGAALVLAGVGAVDDVFSLLEGYFLGRGKHATRPNTYSRRPADFLFLPPFERVRADPRFAPLMTRIGFPGWNRST